MGITPEWVYLDTCIVIYFVEQHPRFGSVITKAIEADMNRRFCISPLVEMECLVLPLRQTNLVMIERYEMFFEDYVRLEITPAIYRKAAELRAQHGLKTPDALHLAVAQYHGCYGFWTNDDRLHTIAKQFAVNLLA